MASSNLSPDNWSFEIFHFLEKHIPAAKGIATFDFDNTLVKNDFGEAVMNTIVATGIPSLTEQSIFTEKFRDKEHAKKLWEGRKTNSGDFSAYIWNEYIEIMKAKGLEEAYRWSSFIFSGWTEKELKLLAREVWERELRANGEENVKPYPAMIDLIKYLLDYDWDVYIVTASPTWIIQEVVGEFFLPPNKVIGMNLKMANEISLSEIEEPYTYGRGKVEAIERRAGCFTDIAFGDSINDFPMLQSAKLKGILLDRGNVELKNSCLGIGCFIQPLFK